MFDLPADSANADDAQSGDGANPADDPSTDHANPDGRIIDTPGMREFGLVDISRPELSGYFPEMRALAGQCQFNNCLHLEEPGCAVKKAVQEGRIYMDRYVSYCSILDSIGEHKY